MNRLPGLLALPWRRPSGLLARPFADGRTQSRLMESIRESNCQPRDAGVRAGISLMNCWPLGYWGDLITEVLLSFLESIFVGSHFAALAAAHIDSFG